MKNLKTLITVAFAATTFFASCSKDNTDTGNTDETTLVTLGAADATAESVYDDAYNEIMITNEESGLMNRSNTGGNNTVSGKVSSPNGCATITVNPADPAVFPKTVTIDYGTSGCTGTSGIIRKGKIIYNLSGKFRNAGSVISVTFESYSANGYTIAGTYSITNNGGGDGLNVSTQVTGGKITYPDGKYYNYSGAKTLVQAAGVATPDVTDDEFTITGNNTLSSSDGNAVTATIKTALLKKNSCRNIVSGTIEIVYNSIKGLMDYGTGACDNTATITVGNKTEIITLP
jgi:hypothetical protein